MAGGLQLSLGALVFVGACFTKPDRVVFDHDAAVDGALDAASPSLTPRLIRNAYWSNGIGSPGMSSTGFSIDTDGVHDGDLVVFIGSVDNGADTFWAPGNGFAQLTQKYYGNDGQTYVVRYKVASQEPATYAGNYGPQGSSHAAVISLIAIANADTRFPPDLFSSSNQIGADMHPPIGIAPGVTTTVNGSTLIYAGGADWTLSDSSNTVETPLGFTPLTSIGDKGGSNNEWQWSSQQVAYREHVVAGPTGDISGSLTSPTVGGLGWAALIAIAPAAQ
jgi:hypothetical protein